MKILGINHSNDSAAALIEEGLVTRASAEERFSRRKHDSAFPHNAKSFVLSHLDGGVEDCDSVAFFWNPLLHMDARNSRFVNTPRSHLEYLYSVPNQLLSGQDHSGSPYLEMRIPRAGANPLNLFYVTHHLCHAAHAFFESPFEEAAILTVDGYGERTSTLIARGSGTEITPLLEIPFPHSIGSVYAAFTQYLGFRANSGEGKVMGLASYGTPKYRDVIDRMIRPTPDGFEVDAHWFDYMMDRRSRYSQRVVDALGPARAPESPLTQHHMDIAASLQAVVEDLLLHLAKLARQKTGATRLCMAGGVALNCVANGRIAQEAGFEECFFQPSCHDSGTSAGAALYTYYSIHNNDRVIPKVKTDYLGPEFEAQQIRTILETAGVAFRELDAPEEHAARQIADGRIIGRFNGRAEFGPRALGNRSILAAPGPERVKDVVNARVKFREGFRPFAPSVLESHCGTYFECDTPSPFMLRVYKTKEQYRDALGAVTHVDGGARVQTVRDDHNPSYARLIRAVGANTGISTVLNTSFNIRGEPIVHSPQDALKCFFTADMDDLYLGPFHVTKTTS